MEDSVEDVSNAGLFERQPGTPVVIFRQPGANIVDTVDRIRALLPELHASISPFDQHQCGERSHHDDSGFDHDVEITLLISIVLGDPGGLCVPAQCLGHPDPQRCRAAFAGGTFGVMYLLGYTSTIFR